MKVNRDVKIHATAWVLYIIANEILSPFRGETSWSAHLVDLIFSFLSYIGAFYVMALYLLPKLYQNRRYFTFSVGLIVAYLSFTAYNYTVFTLYMSYIDQAAFSESFTHSDFMFWSGRWFFFYSLLGTGYWFHIKSTKQQKKQNELEKKILTHEKDKLKSELLALRTQINPHFLYNTLNFMYDKAQNVSDELSKSIILLSDIMRYALKADVNDRVELKEEMNYLSRYIELQKLRFDDQIFVNVQMPSEHALCGKKIVPFVLVSLVENAFKHGIIDNAASPVCVRLDVNSEKIFFSVKNQKYLRDKSSTKLGNKNTKRRLDLVYADNYSLDLEETSNHFICKLTIEE